MFTTRFVSLAAAWALALTLAACGRPAAPPAVAATPAMPDVSDMDVTTRVKTALLRDDATKAFEVIVLTTKGDVRLSGVMDTQAQKDQALAVTRAIEGVHTVHDEITLKP